MLLYGNGANACSPWFIAVFAMTLFFAKLVAYTFLYWLPYYISTTAVGGRALTPSVSGPCEGRGSLQLHLDAAL
jgi:hypothetical protein